MSSLYGIQDSSKSTFVVITSCLSVRDANLASDIPQENQYYLPKTCLHEVEWLVECRDRTKCASYPTDFKS